MSQDIQASQNPPDSFPFDTDPTNYDHFQSQNEEETSSVWGKLIPITTKLKCQVLELERDVYSFGRLSSCDVYFTNSNMCNDSLKVISKVHFKIRRSKAFPSYITYLEDLSSNGTYVNGKKIGKNRGIHLKSNDIIALAMPNIKVFVFVDSLDKDYLKYPLEIRNKYMVATELGSGACGKVRLVFEKNTQKMFAMKIIQKGKYSVGAINDPKKIENEVKILQTLCYPFVIEVEDFLDTPDQCFIILTLAEGGNLHEYITKKDSLSESEAKKIFYQVALGIRYLHSKGITHRDLKPQNILLTSHDNDSVVKITDFGLSKITENPTLSSELSGSWTSPDRNKACLMKTVCGSPLYVAPEILSAIFGKNSAGYTHKVDIWSMGVTLYICLSGMSPFLKVCECDSSTCLGDVNGMDKCNARGINRQQTLQDAIMSGAYSFPRKAWHSKSRTVKDLIRKMLTVDPDKRITIEEILNHEWLQDDEMKTKIHALIENQPLGIKYERRHDRSTSDSKQRSNIKRQRLSEHDDDI